MDLNPPPIRPSMVESTPKRQLRADGEASRELILEAATMLAGERGYDGTSILLISERSGLPASSIYWHFKNKDELIAAVIRRSHEKWLRAFNAEAQLRLDDDQVIDRAFTRVGATHLEVPDFLTLGLMLLLEKRPQELLARREFLEFRREALQMASAFWRISFPSLGDPSLQKLATLSIASVDGLFIAYQTEGADFRLHLELIGRGLMHTAQELQAAEQTQGPDENSPASQSESQPNESLALFAGK